jgi:hypothetical protein
MDRRVIILIGILFLAGLVSADVISINSGGGTGIIINPAQIVEGFFFQANEAPTAPNPILVSVDGRNETTADLRCYFDVLDADGDNINVSVKWYKGAVEQLYFNYSNIVNGTLYNATLDQGNLTLGDVWMCSVRYYDGIEYTSWVDSNNLTIIDITAPAVFIISPESMNYSQLNFTYNVSMNEAGSDCFYDLDFAGNLSMDQLNSMDFGYNDSLLGPGYHDIIFYCNDTSGNWGMNSTNFTVDNEAAIAILLSSNLSQYVKWNIVTLPIDDLDAEGNNLNASTSYYINISATNTLVDVYVKADGDLNTAADDVLGLGNETYAVSTSDSTVEGAPRVAMTTNYSLIGSGLGDISVIYIKFYLDAPSSQAAGEYINQLSFKAVRNGQPVE